ncbi:cellulase family glycosylhydrolase [Spirosoma soli]|uniref:Cellulase family glycosylhydrolase n=1 Tax=Spirosoma soli TaxID=1770529 RepID=A0ABW5M2I5_9BACT
MALLLCMSMTLSNGQTIVQQYGQLRVSGNRILDKNGQAIQLRGMSLYWSQWIPKYYTYNTIKWLRDDWKVTVVRAAMAVDNGGYATNPTAEKNKVFTVIDAAISLGIYVIVDFHVHEAQNYRTQAQTFFREVAQKYGNTPNVLYEPWNEPFDVSWANVIKPYHEAVISTIRQYDPDNIIICGTRFYSQEVDEAAANPINQPNIAYTLHYYADTHRQYLRDKAQSALNRNRALFVTEYGTTGASGDGTVNETETKAWWAFLDQNKVSHANWSVADIGESSAALQSGASPDGGWSLSQIKPSGQLVRTELRAKNPLTTTPPPATGGLANGVYRITARHSGKSLDVAGYSQTDGANVQQYTYSGGTNQQWSVTSLGNGQYSIRAVHSSKSLDVSGASTADNADINQWTYSGGNNQRWKIETVSTGYYRIVSVNSNKCVNVVGGSTADAASISQLTCNSSSNSQQFQFQLLSSGRLPAEAVSMEEAVQVYPNPSTGSFTVRKGGSFTFDVNDVSGKALQSGQGVDQATVGSNLAPGFYILRVQSGRDVQVLKLIKQ